MNYYELLEVNITATQEEIKKAYYRLAKKYHPDINPSANALIMMQQINEAYDTLSNLEQRKKYDAAIKDKLKENHTYTGKSYKPQEESEEDLDEWILKYIKSRTELNSLFILFIKINSKIEQQASNFIISSSEDVLLRDTLKQLIKEYLENFIKDFTNQPLLAIQFLLSELLWCINKFIAIPNNKANDYFMDSAIIIKELSPFIKKALNGPQGKKVLTYLIRIYNEFDSYANTNKSIAFVQNILLKALKQNQDIIKNLTEDDLKL